MPAEECPVRPDPADPTPAGRPLGPLRRRARGVQPARLRPGRRPLSPTARWPGSTSSPAGSKWSRVVHVRPRPRRARGERWSARCWPASRRSAASRSSPCGTIPRPSCMSRKGDLIVWNPIFGQVALDFRFAPELCWPRAGQQKGAVENLVGWVKGSFFKCPALPRPGRPDRPNWPQWLTEGNTRRPVPGDRDHPERAPGTQEQRRLAPPADRPRGLRPGDPRRRHGPGPRPPRRASTYSMPPATIGQPATLHLFPDRVEIVTKTGPPGPARRTPARGQASLLPEHRAAMLGRRPGRPGPSVLPAPEPLGTRARRRSLAHRAGPSPARSAGARTSNSASRSCRRTGPRPGRLRRRRPAARHRRRIRRARLRGLDAARRARRASRTDADEGGRISYPPRRWRAMTHGPAIDLDGLLRAAALAHGPPAVSRAGPAGEK